MTKAEFNNLVLNPSSITPSQTVEVNDLLKDFSYCHSLHLMQCVGLKKERSIYFGTNLKQAALHVANRRVLYNLVIRPDLIETVVTVEEGEVAPNIPSLLQPIETGQINTIEASPDANSEKTPQNNTQEPAELKPAEIEVLEQQIITQAISDSINLEVSGYVLETESEGVTNEVPSSRETTKKAIPESQSFSEWLKYTSGTADSGEENIDHRPKIESLIQRFMDTEQKITPAKAEFFSPTNMGRLSIVDNEEYVTETLAGIYAKQGNLDKAIRAYEKLSLSFPEKRTYFAALIEKLQEGLKD